MLCDALKNDMFFIVSAFRWDEFSKTTILPCAGDLDNYENPLVWLKHLFGAVAGTYVQRNTVPQAYKQHIAGKLFQNGRHSETTSGGGCFRMAAMLIHHSMLAAEYPNSTADGEQ